MEEQTGLSFSYDLEGIDRRALLTQMASELHALRGDLGSGSAGTGKTPEEAVVLDIATKDTVGFDKGGSLYPDKITEEDFVYKKVPVPEPFQRLSQTFSFYRLRIPFNLWSSRRDWGFYYLEMQVVMSAPGNKQPVAYQILPAKKFQDLINLKGRLEVSLGENFEFEVSPPSLAIATGIPGVGASIKAGIDAKAESRVGLSIGPFEFRWKKSKIEHDGVGTRRVFWRIDGAEFVREQDLDLVIIIQVPKTVNELTIDAQMLAKRNFNLANSNLQRAVAQLPEVLYVRFLKDGAPIGDKHSWLLSLS
jgi:hypothetical protein